MALAPRLRRALRSGLLLPAIAAGAAPATQAPPVAAVSQGITTLVGGQDGDSILPLGNLFARLERAPPAVNVAVVYEGGRTTGARPGRVLRRPAAQDASNGRRPATQDARNAP